MQRGELAGAKQIGELVRVLGGEVFACHVDGARDEVEADGG